MPEYVYALHDFAPEHEDEIPFSAGDRIEVIEKDDMYGDGWWQGRNIFGKIGLFPQTYTTSDPTVFQSTPPSQQASIKDEQSGGIAGAGSTSPGAQGATRSPLQTLSEESDIASVTSDTNRKVESPTDGNGVMRATMTDVQEAIEQLGRKDDRDGNGSFSFSSTKDDTTESERETDNEAGEGEGWHKGARSSLAEKARLQQQAAHDENLRTPMPSVHLTEPPIDFEMSDESEDEGDEQGLEHEAGLRSDMHFPHRSHARISEGEEDEEEDAARQVNGYDAHTLAPSVDQQEAKPLSASPDSPISEELTIPERNETDPQTVTARQLSFKTEALPDSSDIPHQGNTITEAQAETPPNKAAPLLTPTSPTTSVGQSTNIETPTPPAVMAKEPVLKNRPVPLSLPSPPPSHNGTMTNQAAKSPSTHPSEWSVEEVVEWAKSKGFDSTVTDKFIEHEISGDVLLELDSNILKTELEIHAFGKRTRIVKEIAELRRPPSITSSEQRGSSQAHSHSLSQSISLPNSAHHSLNSPHIGEIAASPAPMSSRHDSDFGSSVHASVTDQDPESTAADTTNSSMVGLGIGLAASVATASTLGADDQFIPKTKNRPAQLNLSPSDNSLSIKAKSARFSPLASEDTISREERAALSDTESPHALDSRSKRRRLFTRSSGSAHSDSRESTTPTSVPGSPSTKRGSIDDGSVRAVQRRKQRSIDVSKTSDRLSFFGSMGISRSRKPPPRVHSAYAHDDIATEKSSKSISRLYLGGGRKTSVKSQLSDVDNSRDPQVLRKRTTSHSELPVVTVTTGLKPGVSVLDQIGKGDHSGWMRKKGERYNTWKLRYFVLQGPHLYYLESDSKTLTKIKGYINIIGYKVIVDENVNPGRYGFRLIHEVEKTHYFSSEEQMIVREWMKALMKATIGRDYSRPVISSCNIPTIPLSVAQAMNPSPRPPSPTQRDATQKALRRENPNQLSSRDARILMGLPSETNGSANEKGRSDDQFYSLEPLPSPKIEESVPAFVPSSAPVSVPPVRPSREARRASVPPLDGPSAPVDLVQWANAHLPESLRISEEGGQLYNGLALYRLAEAIKGRPTDPPVPDSAFPTGPNDDRLDGLFKLFDFFLDNDIRMGSVSINDVRQGRRDKIIHLLQSLKNWEEKRKNMARSFVKGTAHAGPFMALDSGSLRAW